MSHLNRNKVFALLGTVPTNPRWSWCAISPDHKLAVFTIWEDEMVSGRNRLLWDQTTSRHGEADQQRIIDLVLEGNIPTYGLICIARDPEANTRSIKGVHGDYLMRLKIAKDAAGVWGYHKGKILLAEVVNNLGRLKNLYKNGLADLAHPPDGVEVPDRALSVGYTVIRNDKVRAHVIRRANGKCEYCGDVGFLMSNGQNYLEAHHVIALSNQGPDTIDNVIALCPLHHRQAHYGKDAELLEDKFISILRMQQKPTSHQGARILDAGLGA